MREKLNGFSGEAHSRTVFIEIHHLKGASDSARTGPAAPKGHLVFAKSQSFAQVDMRFRRLSGKRACDSRSFGKDFLITLIRLKTFSKGDGV
jgi:hypothetical protein